MRVAGSYSWRIFCASRFAGMTTRTARSPPASCADWTLFQQGIVELRSIRAEGTEFRLLDAGQPFAALTLVRARRAGPCHIAQALDGQLSSIDTKPGEHLVQQLFRAGTSCDQRLNLRAREAGIRQNGIEEPDGLELREFALQLLALAPPIDEVRDRSPARARLID
jgi:hypothetical protein